LSYLNFNDKINLTLGVKEDFLKWLKIKSNNLDVEGLNAKEEIKLWYI